MDKKLTLEDIPALPIGEGGEKLIEKKAPETAAAAPLTTDFLELVRLIREMKEEMKSVKDRLGDLEDELYKKKNRRNN